MLKTDEKYMRRCIQLARNGMANARPNPMVGAVIVHNDRIIGEGYHVRCGEGHAEVNACASVKKEDEHLLSESTIYVSLEPCSHYGKTPPCADLLISKHFKRCVIGCKDSFSEVQGRGIEKLRTAGIEVTIGVLEEECKALNRHFFTFHEKHRPFITLKWAQSADGYIDGHISNKHTQMLCHKRRSEHQAILIGRRTYELDNPSLNVREWHGTSPKRYVVSSNDLSLPKGFNLIRTNSIADILSHLHNDGIQSVLIEGGSHLLQSFIDSQQWDECYVEHGSTAIYGSVPAPLLPKDICPVEETSYMGNTMFFYRKNTI